MPTVEPSRARALHVVLLTGVVCGDPVTSTTHDGVELTSFDVAVADEGGRTLVPVTLRGAPCPVVADDEVAVRGRVVKRFHRAGAVTVARTSVEAAELLRGPRPATVRRLVERALATDAAPPPGGGRRGPIGPSTQNPR
jgi:hypothetical protein